MSTLSSFAGVLLPYGMTSFLDLTAKVAVLIVLAALAAMLLRRAAAATRHLVWLCALAATLLLPAISQIIPSHLTTYWKAPTLAPVAPIATTGQAGDDEPLKPTQSPAADKPVVAGSNEPMPGEVSASRSMRSIPWGAIALGIYLTGVLSIALQIALGVFGVSRLRRESVAFAPRSLPTSILADLVRESAIRRPISLCHHEDAIPMTWGWIRPIVLLPPEAEGWDAERLRVVLLHELAHITRCDWPTQMVAQIACAVYWYNPLVWWGIHRMRAESENACDDRVLLAGVSSDVYARHLLEIASLSGSRDNNIGVRFAAPMARRAGLELRFRAILAYRASRLWHLRRRQMAMALVLTGLALLPFVSLRPEALRETIFIPELGVTLKGTATRRPNPLRRSLPGSQELIQTYVSELTPGLAPMGHWRIETYESRKVRPFSPALRDIKSGEPLPSICGPGDKPASLADFIKGSNFEDFSDQFRFESRLRFLRVLEQVAVRDQSVTFHNVRFVSEVNPVIGHSTMVGTWNHLIVSRAQTVRTADGLEVTLPEQNTNSANVVGPMPWLQIRIQSRGPKIGERSIIGLESPLYRTFGARDIESRLTGIGPFQNVVANDVPGNPDESIIGFGWSRSGFQANPVENGSLTLHIREWVVLKRIPLEFTVPIRDAQSEPRARRQNDR